MSVKYIRYTDEKTEPVARKPISVGKDPAAQGFLRMFGQPTKLPGQDDEGYGGKITTDKMVYVNRSDTSTNGNARGGRWYRVYATCYGNATSSWVLIGKTRYHLR